MTKTSLDQSPPDPDELEVDVFGRGFGEAVCIHVGGSEWVTVDSCLNPETRKPAALSYLESLGLDPSEVVRLVLVTHWDDDHIAGVGNIVEVCKRATVACSAALRRQEILEFVISQELTAGALGSGLDELRAILRLARNRIVWAKANLPLHPRPPGDQPAVIALSPSEDSVLRSVESLIEEATGREVTVARRYRAADGPNAASVAAFVRRGDIGLLLGADLEKSNNPDAGWGAVLKYSKPVVRASLVKVPHHGSPDAHDPEMWRELAENEVIAIVTPWAGGGRFRPRDEDLARLRELTHRLYLTAMPSFTPAKLDSELERMLRKLHPGKLTELRGWGHVRARRRLDDGGWRIELDGDARAIDRAHDSPETKDAGD